MKKSVTLILSLAFVFVMSFSFAVFAYNNSTSVSEKKESPDIQSATVTLEDIKKAMESVDQEIRDTVSVDSDQFHETSLPKLNGQKQLRLNSINSSNVTANSFKNNWAATAYAQIQEEAPIGSTYPLVFMNRDGKSMIMLYKNPDGSIVEKIATYQEAKGEMFDLYQMYRISETTFSGSQLPQVMKVD